MAAGASATTAGMTIWGRRVEAECITDSFIYLHLIGMSIDDLEKPWVLVPQANDEHVYRLY